MKPIFHNGRFADPAFMNAVLVGIFGLGLLIAMGAMLSLQGHARTAAPLLAILVAAAASSIAGFAFSALCGALLFHLMDSPVYAVEVMILCSTRSSCSVSRRCGIRSTGSLRSSCGRCPGACGRLAAAAPDRRLSRCGRALLIVMAAFAAATADAGTANWSARRCMRRFPAGSPAVAGFPGAFVTIWCGLKGWDKARQRGLYQPFILFMQPVGLIAIHLMRPASSTAAQLNWASLAFVPAALLGAWFGLCVFKRLTDRQFELAVNLLLVAAGIGLIL